MLRLSDWGKEEAGRRFIQLINELQVVLPSDRWSRVETQPGIDSIRIRTYEDQNSDARIDIVMVQLEMQGEYSYLLTIFWVGGDGTSTPMMMVTFWIRAGDISTFVDITTRRRA